MKAEIHLRHTAQERARPEAHAAPPYAGLQLRVRVWAALAALAHVCLVFQELTRLMSRTQHKSCHMSAA